MHFLYRPQGLQVRQRVTEVFQTGGVGGPNATLVSLPPLQQKVVQQRVCECTWARCVYDPLRSAARLTFHVAFSTATRGQSHHPPSPHLPVTTRRGGRLESSRERASSTSGRKTSWKLDLNGTVNVWWSERTDWPCEMTNTGLK